MILTPSRLAGANDPAPNGEVVLSALSDVDGHTPGLVAVFGATSFDVFHVADRIVDSFDDRAELRGHIAELAEETRREFVEHGLFTGLSPTRDPSRVEYRSREYGDGRLVQVFVGGRGMLFAVEEGASVESLAETAAQLLGGL